MRALVLHDFHDLRLEQRDRPRLDAGSVLLRVHEVGICGSDLHGYTGQNGRRRPGQVMGHEAAGSVVEDPTGRFLPGQRVTFNPLVSCGDCPSCRRGEDQHCPTRWVIGVAAEYSAAFADYVSVPVENVLPLPAELSTVEGALVEPLAVAVHAVRRSAVSEGARVLVVGGGPIGQSLVLAARHAGADAVLVSEPDAGRREVCARLGATVVDPAAHSVPEAVVKELGEPADTAFDAVGVSATLEAALASTRPGGTVALVGMGSPTIELPAMAISTAERRLVGCYAYGRADFVGALDLGAASRTQLASLVHEIVDATMAREAFQTMAGGSLPPGKVLIRFATSEGGREASWS